MKMSRLGAIAIAARCVSIEVVAEKESANHTHFSRHARLN